MPDIEFKKECDIFKLTLELKEGGFSIHGCSEELRPEGWVTTVHLRPDETKDPGPLVEAHIPEPAEAAKAVSYILSDLLLMPSEEEKLRSLAAAVSLDYDAVPGPDPKTLKAAKEIVTQMIADHKLKLETLKVIRNQLPVSKVIKPSKDMTQLKGIREAFKHGKKGPV